MSPSVDSSKQRIHERKYSKPDPVTKRVSERNITEKSYGNYVI